MESAALGTVEEPLAIILPVVNEGVWHRAQPIFTNVARPLSLDAVAGAGVGGASIRMKSANASMSETTAVCGLPEVAGAGVKLSVSSGVALKIQTGVSSRFCGKSWFDRAQLPSFGRMTDCRHLVKPRRFVRKLVVLVLLVAFDRRACRSLFPIVGDPEVGQDPGH